MNKAIISLFTLGVLSFATGAFAADAPATVNGKPIKQIWMDYITKDAIARGQKAGDPLKNAVLNELLGAELAVQEAQRLGMDKTPDYIVSSELSNRKILVNMFLQDQMKKNPITDADIKSAYEQYKKELGDKEFNAKHILVKTEAEAKDLREKLKSGGDFAALAKEHSKDPGSKDTGGDLGFFTRGQMVPQFEEAVFSMNKGDVSDPVQTQFGWHIIKLVDKRTKAPPAFEVVKDRILQSMLLQKASTTAVDLRSKAKIEYVDADIKKAIEERMKAMQPQQGGAASGGEAKPEEKPADKTEETK